MSERRAAIDRAARVEDESDLRKYRTEIPNLVDDLGLSVYAQRLYQHIKRRAGGDDGGECTEGLRGMARHCKMAVGTASKARTELLKRGLIRARTITTRDGKLDVITVADIWPANFAFYDALKRGAIIARGDEITRAADTFLASFLSDGCSSGDTPPVLSDEQGCITTRTPGVSPRERKKEPSEERTREEPPPRARKRARPSAARAARAGVGESSGSRFDFSEIHEWTKARHTAGAKIDPYAVARARWRDGTADEDIAAWLEGQTPEAVTRSLQTPKHSQMSFRAALVYLGSILDVNPKLDIAGAVAQLDVSAETREQLLTYDFSKRRGAVAAGGA